MIADTSMPGDEELLRQTNVIYGDITWGTNAGALVAKIIMWGIATQLSGDGTSSERLRLCPNPKTH
jgi:hypothetical protein